MVFGVVSTAFLSRFAGIERWLLRTGMRRDVEFGVHPELTKRVTPDLLLVLIVESDRGVRDSRTESSRLAAPGGGSLSRRLAGGKEGWPT